MQSGSTAPARFSRRNRASRERGDTSATYNLFIAVVTIIALVVVVAYYLLPMPEEVRQVLYILDSLNAFILLADFLYRFYRAPNRPKYLVGFGWLDLIGAIPGFPMLRLARIPTLIRLIRRLNRDTPEEVRRDASQRLASSTLLTTILVVLLVVTVGSILVVLVEKDAPGGNILTGDDAVWWSIVTIATVGYGDRYPTTPEGRLIGVLMIFVGVSLFSVLTSYVATTFVARRRRADDEDNVAALRREMADFFAEQRLRDQNELSALQTELSQVQRLLEELKTPPNHLG
jgi:voltage-gated potassium channel